MLCINAKKKTPILESFLDGGGGENRTRVFPVQQYVTTSLVQHRFSMFRNIWFLAEQPTNLFRLGFLESQPVCSTTKDFCSKVMCPDRPVVVLSYYAPTTASSLVKPRAASLANVLPVMFTTDVLSRR